MSFYSYVILGITITVHTLDGFSDILNRMLCGPTCRSGRFGEDNILLKIAHTKIIQSHNDDDDNNNNNNNNFSGNTVEDCA